MGMKINIESAYIYVSDLDLPQTAELELIEVISIPATCIT